MSEPTRAEICKGMRELANWYEAHPEVMEPHVPQLAFYPEDKAELTTLVRAMRTAGKSESVDGESVWVQRHFSGGAFIDVYYNKKICCERIQTGTRHVPAETVPAQPKRVIEAHEEPVYEWKCPPLLVDSEAEQDSERVAAEATP